MDEATEATLDLLCKFSELCRAGELDAALTALSRYVKADRRDVLIRCAPPAHGPSALTRV